jgi:hypothetical protein
MEDRRWTIVDRRWKIKISSLNKIGYSQQINYGQSFIKNKTCTEVNLTIIFLTTP